MFADVTPVYRRLGDGLDDFDWVGEEDYVALLNEPAVAGVSGVDDAVFELDVDWVRLFLADVFYDTCAVDDAPDFLAFLEHGLTFFS